LTGEIPPGAEQRREGHHVHVDLALVVRRPTGEHAAPLDHRLERRRVPEIERIDGLDVVMAVDEDRRRVRTGMEPVGIDRRVARGFVEGDVLRAGRAERVGEPGGGGPAVVAVPRLPGDAGDPQEGLVALEALVEGRVEMGFELGVGKGHAAMVAARLIGW
jgi:hypothetical protein